MHERIITVRNLFLEPRECGLSGLSVDGIIYMHNIAPVCLSVCLLQVQKCDSDSKLIFISLHILNLNRPIYHVKVSFESVTPIQHYSANDINGHF